MITTVTMNASIDKAYHVDQTTGWGTVMRVSQCQNSAGGKGINVARVIDLCGAKVKTTGIIGGYNGDYLLHLLEQDKIAHDFFRADIETRSCINILAKDSGSTEFLEAGCEISKDDQREFAAFFERVIKDSSTVVLSGSAPKGFAADIYAQLIQTAKAKGKRILLDTSGSYLKEGMNAKPDLVKPNLEELGQLLGRHIRSAKEVLECKEELAKLGIPNILISMGADGAILFHEQGCFHAKPENIQAINTVGCGDSMVGAFAAALERGNTPKECLLYSVAVSAANALSMRTGYFEQEDLNRIINRAKVKQL